MMAARNVTEADAGFALHNGDRPGLVRAIRTLAASPAECAHLGTNARAFFFSNYEHKVCCDAWADLLTEICRQ